MASIVLTDGQERALFLSLRDQYENCRPMTDAEEKTMWDLQGNIWRKQGGRFGFFRVREKIRQKNKKQCLQ